MQLTHVTTNLGQGLRRNLSMHVAVILTLFVSLTLAGIGVMLNKQAQLTTDVLGDELQIQVYLCVGGEREFPECTSEVTDEQKRVIEQAIDESPEAESYDYVSKQEGYDKTRELLDDEVFDRDDPPITVEDFPEGIWVTLKDPDEFDGLVSAVAGLPGVRSITTAKDLVEPVFTVIDVLKYASWGAAGLLLFSAILLVANTIRLAALARRKEIEIMRLVGASRFFIALPFLLEALVTALIGVVMAGGALAAFTYWAIVRGLDSNTDALPFVGWQDYAETMVYVGIAGPILTVIPTLLLTRKYLRV